ncbi:hypothetical protein [Roseburia sp. 1XD42-69]|uniref:hypothetical protein n=1 Tax=Roseburia sp. 1XD42-69 TaxID=2320088 RepID=UPI000EA235BA|nr:hypothetical protein [Roseburia sp. 1XD42-69]MCX4318413.1 hypothetical protein [Lachnospiraceae bacterium]RKJ66137.1 hypothetical protein D7Y06_08340 [Roseburia sp. 1XD42-69]
MKKGMIKLLVLAGVFLLGVIVFGELTNHSNEDLTTEMADATLPVVSFFMKGEGENQEVNELRGYTKEMQSVYMRDAITTVSSDRLLPLQVQTYDTKIDEISYEIRSLDASRLIADSKVEVYEEKKGRIKAELTIQNLLEENEEYLFIIKLKSGGDTIYYYTRIMEETVCHTKECVDFAMSFHEKTFDVDEARELATYLEPNASGDNSNLHKVDIHSSLKQVAWADFKGERLTTPVPSLKEVNDSYTVVVLDYLVASIGINGEMEYYNVEEYYRVRYTNDRMYLLNYERTMNQIFRAENESFYNNYIQLGIRDSEVEFASNEKGNIVSFVQEGELWSYNESSNQLSQVFSFIGNEGIDKRENYGEHDIKIINIDETGSVNFVVYGYMNCGSHEGQVGICVYHYDSIANTTEEELFIPSSSSYQVMRADLGQLMYENAQGIFFIMLGGTVYRIDLSTMEVKEFITGLSQGDYAISESHKYFAWTEKDGQGMGTGIHLMDLDTGDKKELSPGGEGYLKTLGFMQEDFVYGIARKEDVVKDLTGNVTFPMYKVCIMDSSTAEQLKEYEKPGYYVSDIEIWDYIMYLNRIQFNGMAYVEASQDTIMNREGDSATIVDVHSTVTEVKQTQVQLSMVDMVKEASPKILTPKEVVFENNREIALKSEDVKDNYYAYARGDILAVTDNLKMAVSTANEKMGVVIGEKQQYIWKRARKSLQEALEVSVGTEDAGGSSIVQCVSAILERESVNIEVAALIGQGKTPKEILETTMEGVTALDLTGCSLEEVLYYVSLGNPVFAMKSDMDAVLVVGYDSLNVTLFNPLDSTVEKMGMEDAGEMFENAGNVFLGYLK